MTPLETPNRIPWPPILLVICIGIGAASLLLPLRFGPVFGQRVVGAALLVVGVAFVGWAFLHFRANRANIRPNRPADLLMTDGPFAWSRNPIYCGEVIALTGLALLLGAPGFLFAAASLALLVTEMGIKREEAHLAAKFGADWRTYAEKVRRWL
jgi:protein-S-isoprenylcysteine O-methyltransferase Ste14